MPSHPDPNIQGYGEDATPRSRDGRLPDRSFNPLTGLAAAVVPGLGHWILGERDRAALIAVGVIGLAVAGLLIGGLGVVDSIGSKGWFIAQAFLGPATFAIDAVHQFRSSAVVAPVGRPAEIGSLYVAIAGMLNLAAIIDALFPRVLTEPKGGGHA